VDGPGGGPGLIVAPARSRPPEAVRRPRRPVGDAGPVSSPIRPVTPADVPAVVGLVEELAAYERATDECHLTAEQLHAAEVDGEVAGTTLWFLNFSTWNGVHGIYLEDLVVTPPHRGRGLGGALLRELAVECVRRGYSRLEWSVLDWNAPAIGFYRSLGAEPMDEWTVHRLTGPALTALGTPTSPH